ncbi:MAG: hypothetical protein ACMXYG_01810 [Candidatus Woesearchaeota archaeon]
MNQQIIKKKIENWNKKRYIIIISILFLITFTLLTSINYKISNDTILNDKTYDIIRQSNHNDNIDPLIDKEWESKSWVILSLLNPIEINIRLIIIQILSLIISIILIYKIIEKPTSILIILPFTPFFIQTYISFTDFTIMINLVLLITLLLKKQLYNYSIILNIIITYFNFFIGIFISAIMLFLYLKKEIKIYHLIGFILPLGIFFKFKTEIIPTMNTFLEHLLVDFGSMYGISLFLFLMAIAWIIFNENNKFEKYIYTIIIIIGFISFSTFLFILNIATIYLASLSINWLINKKWESNLLKNLSLVLILCSIIFSGISFYKYNIDNRIDIIEGLEWIKDNTKPETLILTHPNYGYQIKFHSERRIFLDNDLHLIENGMEKIRELDEFFKTRNKNNAIDFVNKYNITTILITNEMLQGIVWSRDNEGLMFVMNNNPEFSKIYENENLQIWKLINQ